MQQNHFQLLEMQIPSENTYTGLEIMQNHMSEDKFLKNNFKFPSNNFDEINEFIRSDNEMEKMIHVLPEIISKELPYEKISLDFMKETDPTEKILEIVVYSDLESSRLLQKEDFICDMLIDKYPKTMLEYIILVNPHEK